MSRGRKAIPVDANVFTNVIAEIEKAGPLPSRSALWDAVAATDWAKGIKLTAQVAMLKAKAMSIPCVTPLGKRGRSKGDGPVPNAGKRKTKRMPLELVDELKKAFDPKLHGKVNRASQGSLKAAIALKCIDCSGGSKKEVSLCTVKDCALYWFRPYQGKYKADSPENKSLLTV